MVYILLHTRCNLKATQMNVQYCQNQELMFHKVKLGHNTAKATKNIYCTKGQGTIDLKYINQMFQEISLGLQEPQQSANAR